MNVSSITHFFQASSRAGNDAANKVREDLLAMVAAPPASFLEDPEFGESWRKLQTAWNESLAKIARETRIPEYTHFQATKKAGRGFHYDFDVDYFHGETMVANRKIEFKYGATNIGNLPQFLSLQVKAFHVFPESYDKFYYEKYLDHYLECDKDITIKKPDLEQYLALVSKTEYKAHPFFQQLKDCEDTDAQKKEAKKNDRRLLKSELLQIENEIFSC
jgi:hypothetical protein